MVTALPMPPRRVANPIRRYKLAEGLSHEQVAEQLGCSIETARKTVTELIVVVSPRMAFPWGRRTGKRISFRDTMDWVYDRMVHGPVRDAA